MCRILKNMFGDVRCTSTQVTPVILERILASNISKGSFINLPKAKDARVSKSQLYSPLPSLTHFTRRFSSLLCSQADEKRMCLSRTSLFKTASSLSFSMDLFADKITLSVFWAPQIWDNLKIEHEELIEKTEVGILTVSKSTDWWQNTLGGFVVEMKQDEKAKPTLFSFASRHHDSMQEFSSRYVHPTGLHPTLELEVSSSKPPVEEGDAQCKLHTHLTLPKEIFVDKYQLSDPLFLASKKLSSVKYITTPVDLEAPAYAVNEWGSTVLLELAPPTTTTEEWTAQIPLHLRYLAPNNATSGESKIKIPSPVLFWACTPSVSLAETDLTNNPFDFTTLGYDTFFEEGTLFYHVDSKVGRGEKSLVSDISVPVLDLDKAWYVEYGTAIVVGLGFVWVLWCLGRVFWGGSGMKETVEREKQKKVQ